MAGARGPVGVGGDDGIDQITVAAVDAGVGRAARAPDGKAIGGHGAVVGNAQRGRAHANGAGVKGDFEGGAAARRHAIAGRLRADAEVTGIRPAHRNRRPAQGQRRLARIADGEGAHHRAGAGTRAAKIGVIRPIRRGVAVGNAHAVALHVDDRQLGF